MIRKLSEREHILQRPTMYIGAVNITKSNEYILENNKTYLTPIQAMQYRNVKYEENGDKIKQYVTNEGMNYKEVSYVPGLIKIINEIIDNSVDVAIKTNFKSSNEITIKMVKDYVQVTDNGTGIPVIKNPDGHYLAELAWGHARAGSNFDDDENRTQIGMNGVGSFATNCFSTKFIGQTDDGKKQYTIEFKNNAETFKESVKPSNGDTGTAVKFYPDLEKFGIKEIDEMHMNIIKQRLINLSLSFPDITFKFNGKKININSFKKYVNLFNETSEIIETEDYKFAILPNENDDFRQFSYVNGLKIPDGGTHIDYIVNNVVTGIREKLIKKFKTIKPGDIKNKLMIVAFLKNMKNTKFNSQSKEKITNSIGEITAYYGKIDFDKLNARILKNKNIIESITEVYKIKEEMARRKELKGLSKSTKKIKSDKYYPATKVKKYLLLTEGESAFGGLSPVLGRNECGYYCLKGKPLNAYSADQKKFTANKELTELFQIVQNENYQYIVYATDQDLDGLHIRGLLNGFFHRYLPELKGRIGFIDTPVKVVSNKKNPVRWTYNLSDDIKVGNSETFSYMKGLGSWDTDDLKYIVQKDGLEKMIKLIEWDDEKILDNWLGDDSEPRKVAIMANDFSIAKL